MYVPLTTAWLQTRVSGQFDNFIFGITTIYTYIITADLLPGYYSQSKFKSFVIYFTQFSGGNVQYRPSQALHSDVIKILFADIIEIIKFKESLLFSKAPSSLYWHCWLLPRYNQD